MVIGYLQEIYLELSATHVHGSSVKTPVEENRTRVACSPLWKGAWIMVALKGKYMQLPYKYLFRGFCTQPPCKSFSKGLACNPKALFLRGYPFGAAWKLPQKGFPCRLHAALKGLHENLSEKWSTWGLHANLSQKGLAYGLHVNPF